MNNLLQFQFRLDLSTFRLSIFNFGYLIPPMNVRLQVRVVCTLHPGPPPPLIVSSLSLSPTVIHSLCFECICFMPSSSLFLSLSLRQTDRGNFYKIFCPLTDNSQLVGAHRGVKIDFVSRTRVEITTTPFRNVKLERTNRKRLFCLKVITMSPYPGDRLHTHSAEKYHLCSEQNFRILRA